MPASILQQATQGVRKKRRGLLRAFLFIACRETDYFTSKSLLPTGLSSMLIATEYLPVGQPSGLAMWNSVTDVPAVVTWRLLSLTSVLPLNVQRAVIVDGVAELAFVVTSA